MKSVNGKVKYLIKPRVGLQWLPNSMMQKERGVKTKSPTLNGSRQKNKN